MSNIEKIINDAWKIKDQINNQSMILNVDGENISIDFDHVLLDSSDAHKTLVEMAKK